MGKWIAGGPTRTVDIASLADARREASRTDMGPVQISAFRVSRENWERILDRLVPGGDRAARDGVTSLLGCAVEVLP